MKKILLIVAALFIQNSMGGNMFVSRSMYTKGNETPEQAKKNWQNLISKPFEAYVQIQCQAVTPAPGIFLGTIENPAYTAPKPGTPPMTGGANPTCSVYLVKKP